MHWSDISTIATSNKVMVTNFWHYGHAILALDQHRVFSCSLKIITLSLWRNMQSIQILPIWEISRNSVITKYDQREHSPGILITYDLWWKKLWRQSMMASYHSSQFELVINISSLNLHADQIHIMMKWWPEELMHPDWDYSWGRELAKKPRESTIHMLSCASQCE